MKQYSLNRCLVYVQIKRKRERQMDLGIAGKTALVLGGGGGLGAAIATALHAEGARVAIGDISAEGGQAVAAMLGGDTLARPWDLADLDSIDGHITHIEQALGPVDILVNITGGPPPTPVSGQGADIWDKHFRAMVLSVVAITDRVLPGMKAKNWGRIITSTSSGVVAPIPNLGLSNALRMSLLGWSKTLAREVGRDGITSNIIVPGRIGRYGRPEEYAAATAFLASEAAGYITGTVMRVDGGLIASV
jgi:3-oxoacyl-[acyl-carrier protein] reductase